VDLLVADIRAATPGGKDKLPSGAKQWFDPIAHGDRASQVKPGDVILINSAERHDLDHRASNGHVVIVSSVTRNSAGQITQLRTVGASTSTGRETANGGPNKTPTTFGTVQHGIFQFAAGTEVIRPRLAE
jgi:hypothetical protein